MENGVANGGDENVEPEDEKTAKKEKKKKKQLTENGDKIEEPETGKKEKKKKKQAETEDNEKKKKKQAETDSFRCTSVEEFQCLSTQILVLDRSSKSCWIYMFLQSWFHCCTYLP